MRTKVSAAETIAQQLASYRGRALTFMEVCGTHTMSIARSGLRALLPSNIRLISGPGCPVCVTPVGFIDHALAIAEQTGATLASFGDLIRVPGSRNEKRAKSLRDVRANGADVRVVYSPRDALAFAREEPERQIVLLAVGFETTAPGIAASIRSAAEEKLANFSVLSANKTVPEALVALAKADDIALDGLLCPGHVSVIIGTEPYKRLVHRHGIGCAIAGFEPVEILRGLQSLVSQMKAGEPDVINCYEGAVQPDGNPRAREILYEVFEPVDSVWRGLGNIPLSGLALRDTYAELDARHRFTVNLVEPKEPEGCQCGEVLRGVLEPAQCSLFGRVCTPETPVGACMVSSEGSCAASFTYQRMSDA